MWGFAKKLVIADNVAPFVEAIYRDTPDYNGVMLVVGSVLFAMQVYCDFSGYSDIAIGAARLFGFSLMRNFAYPYFARDMTELWSRWHISLTTWFRDYVYIPLGGNRGGKTRVAVNAVTTFTISGLWHGANWNCILWGFLNGVFLLPTMLRKHRVKRTSTVAAGAYFPSLRDLGAMIVTFGLFLLGLTVFRAHSVGHAATYLWRIFTLSGAGMYDPEVLSVMLYSSLLILVEWFQREKQHGLEIASMPRVLRWCVYIVVVHAILLLGNFGSQEFFYFQF